MRVLGADQLGEVTRLDRHMRDRVWALNHADDHMMVQARIEIPMGGVHRDQHGLSSFDGLLLCANNNNPFALQTKLDFIRDRMVVQAILLAWLKAVHVQWSISVCQIRFRTKLCA
jgi:hypothetical protein